jgi:adenosylmethionine-8-amino-7-oxononanoate aminotransferase
MHLPQLSRSFVLRREYLSTAPAIVCGEGCFVSDDTGRRYLDAASGVGVAILGHGLTEIGELIARESPSLPYVYNAAFTHPWQERLAAEIASVMPEGMASVFLVSGGSEANETAIKLARQYHVETGKPDKYKCIARDLSYHGCTLATLSLSDRPSWKQPFEPLLTDVPRAAAPYEYRCGLCGPGGSCSLACAETLEDVILREGPETVAAFIAEPVLGTTAAGVMPPAGYYQRIRDICDRHDVLFIADEVLVGYGRTGRWTAMEHWGVTPDLTILGKALGAGYAALAAVVASAGVADAVSQGSGRFTHGFTYGGMPISCLVGSEVHRQLTSRALVERVASLGDRLHAGLVQLQSKHECIGDVRGAGLLAGIEFVADRDTKEPFPVSSALTTRVVAGAAERGLLILPGIGGLDGADGGDHVQLSPPYVIEEGELDLALEVLDDTIEEAARTC